jgi:hypothetical protein
MKEITIKDIYAGKPDAKDEINFEGISEFMKSFIVPGNCDLKSLIEGNFCYISGFKGTGKTALLFYLDNVLRERDNSSCSSFVFFKEEFAEMKKEQYEGFTHLEISSISIAKDTLVSNTDFEYIWRWLFYKRIISDNESFNRGIFADDENWQNFVNIIAKIKGPNNLKKSLIPNKVKVAFPVSNPIGTTYSPEVEVDLRNNTTDDRYSKFVELLDEAEELLYKVERTDIPYHIFVDELEAYYGSHDVFTRDLYLIRDLIFTVKRMNAIFYAAEMKNTKIICSYRTEIVNAISRFIVTKELNKVTSGFEIQLKWNYSNTSSFEHPILKILLRRIAISESEDEYLRSEDEIIEQWFREDIHDINPSSYILNNSWHKPRDIVRLIICAQNSLQSNKKTFSQAVFDYLTKSYSVESLTEIKEEMRALYTSDEIEDIINVFTGFRSIFSIKQLKARVNEYFPDTIMKTKFSSVLNDLYRLGFVGNCIPQSKLYHWHHKGDERLIISDEWKLMIHQALQSALSVGKKLDYSMKRNELPESGDIVIFEVDAITKSFVYGYINYYGQVLSAYIHISEIIDGYVSDIKEYIIEERFNAKILGYDEKRQKWMLSVKGLLGLDE